MIPRLCLPPDDTAPSTKTPGSRGSSSDDSTSVRRMAYAQMSPGWRRTCMRIVTPLPPRRVIRRHSYSGGKSSGGGGDSSHDASTSSTLSYSGESMLPLCPRCHATPTVGLRGGSTTRPIGYWSDEGTWVWQCTRTKGAARTPCEYVWADYGGQPIVGGHCASCGAAQQHVALVVMDGDTAFNYTCIQCGALPTDLVRPRMPPQNRSGRVRRFEQQRRMTIETS